MLDLISTAFRDRIPALAAEFATAKPFRHVVIDDFLEPSFASGLLAEFPSFAAGNRIGENGKPGSKSTSERMKALGPNHIRLDEIIRSPGFLAGLGEITAIPGLIHDPWYLGGGTHENIHGASLSPHIDFNYHPLERWHRRLNLILYLNHGWSPHWGGQLALYADPRRHAPPDVSISPEFNRCVIFETTARSWHGFDRIALPESARDRSRKSIAVYFYTRPMDLVDADEQAHSTVYVGPRLPPQLRSGHTLDDDDIAQLHALVDAHDQRSAMQYDEIGRLMDLVRAHEKGTLGAAMYFVRKLGHRLRRS